MTTRKLPPYAHGQGDGLLDPNRITIEGRLRKGPERIAAERADARVLSPTIRRLRAVARRALGGRR